MSESARARAAVLDPFISKWAQAFALCPTGTIVVGGGFVIVSGAADLLISVNDPVGSLAWEIHAWSNNQAKFRAVARCLQA